MIKKETIGQKILNILLLAGLLACLFIVFVVIPEEYLIGAAIGILLSVWLNKEEKVAEAVKTVKKFKHESAIGQKIFGIVQFILLIAGLIVGVVTVLRVVPDKYLIGALIGATLNYLSHGEKLPK